MTLMQILIARRARKRAQGKPLDACDVRGCRAPATHKLRFRIWPRGALPGITQPMEGDMSLAVCDEHAPAVKASDHFNDRNWPRIVEGFRRRRLASPDRESAQVFTVRLQ